MELSEDRKSNPVERRVASKTASTNLTAQSINIMQHIDTKKLAGVGNYVELFSIHKPNVLEAIYSILGFTENGYIVGIDINTISYKSAAHVYDALTSVVHKKLHTLDISEDCMLPLCVSHDMENISIIGCKPSKLPESEGPLLSIPKISYPLITSLRADNIVKIATKTFKKQIPIYTRLSKGKTYLFVGYKESFDVIEIKYESGAVPLSLEVLDSVAPKENLASTYNSRTPLLPSQSQDSFFYYLFKSDEKEEEKYEYPTLTRIKEKEPAFIYFIKQYKIEGKGKILSHNIIKLELESPIKNYEWSNRMGRLVVLMENNDIVSIILGDILKSFEREEPTLKSKFPQTGLLQSFSYRTENLSSRWKSVHWVDSGTLICALCEDLSVSVFDIGLTLLKIKLDSNLLGGISMSQIDVQPMKNKVAQKILEREIAAANKKLILKRSVICNAVDPFIVAGNFPYNLSIYKLGYPMPFHEVKINEGTIISRHLEAGRITSALNIVQYIEEPELLIQNFIHIANFIMRRPKLLACPSLIQTLIKIHAYAMSRPEVQYLRNFFGQYYQQIGQRLLTDGKYEDAFRIGLQIESAILMRNIELYCKWKGRLVMAETAKKEAMKYDQNITSLAQEMTKISEYTHKALTGEDIQNVINDYHTLMNVSSIHELDLDEFNSWEINLKDYEKALQLELDGSYEEAKAIYEKNKLSADAKRAETLAHLTKSMNQNVVQFIDVAEVVNKDK